MKIYDLPQAKGIIVKFIHLGKMYLCSPSKTSKDGLLVKARLIGKDFVDNPTYIHIKTTAKVKKLKDKEYLILDDEQRSTNEDTNKVQANAKTQDLNGIDATGGKG